MTQAAPKMKKRAAKATSYLELHTDGTSSRVELDPRWLANLLEHMPTEALPECELLLSTRAGRTIAGHLLWQGRTVLDAFNDVQVQRILACWMPHWARRSTWDKASKSIAGLVKLRHPTLSGDPPACWMAALPRSGSNHVMHVLSAMANGIYRSIYGGLGQPGGQSTATVVRSHALSPALFDEELIRFTGRPWNSTTPLIALVRDPRDVAISFYEYSQVSLKLDIAQEQFLHGTDFYLASGTDIGSTRRSTLAPTSVIQAMRQFITHWLAADADNDAVHLVRFESLLNDPKNAFMSLASKVGLPERAPTKKALESPVARYDRKRRPRGASQGWKQVRKRYAILIDGVQRELSAEMRLLGYDLESV